MQVSFWIARVIPAVLLAVLGGAVPARANLIVNGSFEEGDFASQCYLPLDSSSQAITGWTIFEADAQGKNIGWMLNGCWVATASDGSLYLDLTGDSDSFPTAGVQQTIPTTPGQVYLLEFDLGSVGGSNRVAASAGGTSDEFVTDAAGCQVWKRARMKFTAASESTLVSFVGLASGDGGIYIGLDNVSVTPFLADTCGNGVVETGEQCDDGNTLSGDCCSPTCQFEPNGSPCVETCPHPCTFDTCDGAGLCGQLPTGCKTAQKSLLLLKNHATDDTKDKLTWKWLKGAEMSLQDLGVPTDTTNYTLCLYAGTASATVAIPAGSNWQTAGSKGYRYKDKSATSYGAQGALLKSGDAGKTKVLVKGKGTNLPDLLAVTDALTPPVKAQLVNDANHTCFEAVYESRDVIRNDPKQFKAKRQ